MKTPTRLALAIAGILWAIPQHAGAQPYQVVYLHNTMFTDTGAADGSGLQQQVGSGFVAGNVHAALWSGTAASAIDLNPAGYLRSDARATTGAIQVGSGIPISTGVTRALMWTGTAASFVDLTPPGWNFATADGADGNQQVGSGSISTSGGPRRALLWSGTAASFVSLHPLSGWQHSYAMAIQGGQQVGQVINDSPLSFHAALWSGTGASFVDLHPSGATNSAAWDVYGGEQVGNVYYGQDAHASLWNSSGYVDLHPAGFSYSNALGIAPGIQVGFLNGPAFGGQSHAMAWFGSPSSSLDLHQYLSANYTSSGAGDIDPVTGIIYGGAWNQTAFRSEAVMWIPVPEPGALACVAWVACVGWMQGKRRDASASQRPLR
jgi:hypothetical protein